MKNRAGLLRPGYLSAMILTPDRSYPRVDFSWLSGGFKRVCYDEADHRQEF
jgi:hypothetical protein